MSGLTQLSMPLARTAPEGVLPEGVPTPLDLVIPVLNEELRIGRTLAALTDHLAAGGIRSA